MILSFTIPGLPQQQGSKRYVGNGVGIDANKKKLAPWRKDAIACAIEARPEGHGPTFTGPVEVKVRFVFPRPQNHYGTGRNASLLKDSSPYWRASAPDVDKLARALSDVLTMSQMVHDDRLIARLEAEKIYGDPPRVDVIITPLGTPPAPMPMPIDEVAGLFAEASASPLLPAPNPSNHPSTGATP